MLKKKKKVNLSEAELDEKMKLITVMNLVDTGVGGWLWLCCVRLQVQQCRPLSAGAPDAALLGVAGGQDTVLDRTEPHHHHRPGHQCLHHPCACLLLPDCHRAGQPSRQACDCPNANDENRDVVKEPYLNWLFWGGLTRIQPDTSRRAFFSEYISEPLKMSRCLTLKTSWYILEHVGRADECEAAED